MSHYTVYLTPTALKDLASLPKKQARMIMGRIKALKNKRWPRSVTKYTDSKFYRIRSGDYRAIFLPRGKKIAIAHVADKKKIKRRLKSSHVPQLIEWLRKQNPPE